MEYLEETLAEMLMLLLRKDTLEYDNVVEGLA
jgi:hypothetical protein